MNATPPTQDLVDLHHTGCKVDLNGRLSNWADRPPAVVRPATQRPAGRKPHRAFSEDELEILSRFCYAAKEQGAMVGVSVFTELECLYPSHPWQTYENKWRSKNTAHTSYPEPYQTALFPNLDLNLRPQAPTVHGPNVPLPPALASSQDQSTGETPQGAPNVPEVTYNDLRIDTMRVVLDHLDLASVDELMTFLSQDWVAQIYVEYHDNYLGPNRDTDQAYIEEHNKLPTTTQGRSQHWWKIDRVSTILRSENSRYFDDNPDMACWDSDDHGIRFMVRIIRAATAPSRIWHKEVATNEWEVRLSRRAFYLVEFLRWVYKLNIGTSREMERTRNRKAEWLKFLNRVRETSRPPMPFQDSPMSTDRVSQSTVQDVHGTNQILYEEGEGRGEDQAEVELARRLSHLSHLDLAPDACTLEAEPYHTSDPVPPTPADPHGLDPGPSSTASPSVDLTFSGADESPPSEDEGGNLEGGTVAAAEMIRGYPFFNYKVRQSNTNNQQKGTFWLTEDAYKIFQNNLNARLNSWGVKADGGGTCVLVPAEWAAVRPVDIMDKFPQGSWPSDEAHASRLWLHIGDTTVLWARASAWFSSWPDHPRRGIDLDQFLVGSKGPFPDMHGSHLCHHGLCIQPRHIVYEERDTNFTRNSCKFAARVMRGYHHSVPEFCSKHEPPCLLQHASLTTNEAICLQIHVLRRSLDLPLTNTFTKPADHPSDFRTFETRLPLQITATAVSAPPASLITPPLHDDAIVLDRFKVRCSFCQGAQRVWSMLPAYWSHLKNQHLAIPHSDRLQEIRKTARAYEEWARTKGHDLQRSNPETWKKLEQVRATNFSWEVVENWRLHLDNHYKQVRDATNAQSGV